jgi:hypothetical protein
MLTFVKLTLTYIYCQVKKCVELNTKLNSPNAFVARCLFIRPLICSRRINNILQHLQDIKILNPTVKQHNHTAPYEQTFSLSFVTNNSCLAFKIIIKLPQAAYCVVDRTRLYCLLQEGIRATAGNRGIAPLILNFRTRRWAVNFKPRALSFQRPPPPGGKENGTCWPGD